MTARQRFAKYAAKRPTPKVMATYFYLLGVLAAFVAAGVLVAAEAQTLLPEPMNFRLDMLCT